MVTGTLSETSNVVVPGEAAAPGAVWRMLAISSGAWAMVAFLQIIATYSDQLRRGGSADLLEIVGDVSWMYPPWALFSVFMYRRWMDFKRPLTHVGVAATELLLVTVCFFLPYEVFMVAVGTLRSGAPIEELGARLARHPAMWLFSDFLLLIGAFGFIYALVIFRRALADERRRRRAEAENLRLQLEIGSYRLASLQAQLEPHFLFNALNAISALVRGGERDLALGSVRRLSDLLRYAITASRRDWATLGDELDFVAGYVALQRLRHGDRLRFHLDVVSESLRRVECPPLILQPLIENAIRHGLESLPGPVDVSMSLVDRGSAIEVTIRNQAPLQSAHAGHGIGIENLRGRLALLYLDRARVDCARQGDEFVVCLELPKQPGD